MKTIIALVLAVIVGGCCSWKPVVVDGKEIPGHWIATKQSESCNCPRYLGMDDTPEHPEKYLYVIHEHSGKCLILLRPAYASDTGRTYRWDELPNAFKPCD